MEGSYYRCCLADFPTVFFRICNFDIWLKNKNTKGWKSVNLQGAGSPRDCGRRWRGSVLFQRQNSPHIVFPSKFYHISIEVFNTRGIWSFPVTFLMGIKYESFLHILHRVYTDAICTSDFYRYFHVYCWQFLLNIQTKYPCVCNPTLCVGLFSGVLQISR